MGKKKQQSEDGPAMVSNAAVEATDEGGENDEENRGGGKGKTQKNDDGSITVVLKIDMHCEGCSKKVIKSVRGTQGVEAVKADAGTGKLTVVGMLDPWKLRDQVEAKSHKKVDLVSPANFPRNANAAKKPSAAKQTDEKKKPQEKLVVTTVTLKIRLHCEGCIRRIRKTILKIKGVESVVFDTQTDQVTVKGTMDAKSLPEKLKSKLKRDVAVVQPKKDKGDGGGDAEKKKNKDGGEEKKKGGKGEGGGGGGGEKENPAAAAGAPAGYAMEYYGGYEHRFDMVHAPQLFSDENPNSCSVM
ncbi:LOW QUALITY PROTEIN: heavy metal-associated isoprenylated plant protein 3-like [Curcuma longa]|uniref:LOW QUALITY PROTEIN: heavy metal-associated isoprenylated plant protein 3-like n=1 Tax=Curcuma longa TaxID=136217 RepID=UPI003D9FA78F